MAQELIYTSVARGLVAGTRGFCIAAASPGIDPRIKTVLESLSGYRHLNAPNGPPHPGNPTVYSHLILSSGQSLLSRIADAGLDYSKRTNKLAHHIVAERGDLLPCGPAAMLAESNNFPATFDGEPRNLSPRSLLQGAVPTGKCTVWKRYAGDAGWAGQLAQSAATSSPIAHMIVVTPDMDAISLVSEALSLLPPAKRWNVSFSTFFTGLPVGIRCDWKFVMAGSAEHQQLMSSSIETIDLTQSMGQAPDSRCAADARNGTRQAATPSPAAATASTVSKVPTDAVAGLPPVPPARPPAPGMPKAVNPQGDAYRLAPFDSQIKGRAKQIAAPPPVHLPADKTKHSTGNGWMIVAALALSSILIISIGFFGYVLLKDQDQDQAMIAINMPPATTDPLTSTVTTPAAPADSNVTANAETSVMVEAPAAEVAAPAEEPAAPAEEPAAPAEEPAAPAEEPAAPAEEPAAPAEETPAPAEETPAPAEEAPAVPPEITISGFANAKFDDIASAKICSLASKTLNVSTELEIKDDKLSQEGLEPTPIFNITKERLVVPLKKWDEDFEDAFLLLESKGSELTLLTSKFAATEPIELPLKKKKITQAINSSSVEYKSLELSVDAKSARWKKAKSSTQSMELEVAAIINQNSARKQTITFELKQEKKKNKTENQLEISTTNTETEEPSDNLPEYAQLTKELEGKSISVAVLIRDVTFPDQQKRNLVLQRFEIFIVEPSGNSK
jgi:hypothetical protein